MDSNDKKERLVTFSLGGMLFEYDEVKNQKNIEKHGISFKSAVRVFWDYDRIEFYDEENSSDEDRYDTIGDLTAGNIRLSAMKDETTIGSVVGAPKDKEDVLFVVYTERIQVNDSGIATEVTRIISARSATSFERGLYYGKC